MLVSFAPSFNQNKKVNNLKQFSQINYHSKPLLKDKVSFGDGGATLIYLVARGGLGALKNGPKDYNILKLLEEVDGVIKSPSFHSEKLADTLSAMSKISDNAQTVMSDLIGLFSDKKAGLYVNELRINAIPLLSKTMDNSHVNIQSKKDFIRSLLDNGFSIDSEFATEFRRLDDTHYKAFKQEIVDDALYSKKYAQKESELFYKNDYSFTPGTDYTYARTLRTLDLVETLNPVTHSEYLKKIQPTVIDLKKQVFSFITASSSSLADRFIPPNKFAQFKRFKHLGQHDKYTEILWNETTKALNYDTTRISKALNMPEKDVKYMLLYNQLQ